MTLSSHLIVLSEVAMSYLQHGAELPPTNVLQTLEDGISGQRLSIARSIHKCLHQTYTRIIYLINHVINFKESVCRPSPGIDL